HVLGVLEGNATGWQRNVVVGVRGHLRFRALQTTFDLANALEVVVEQVAIVLTQVALEARGLRGHGVEDALILAAANEARRSVVALPEHPLEHLARIDLHGHRCRRRAPRQGIHIYTAVIAVARADQTGV